MAARTYFDKSADELDVLESATLIGMLKGTSYYNPVLNPERALQRRNLVLAQMVEVRQARACAARVAEAPAAAARFRAADRSARPRAALRAAVAQVADRLGRRTTTTTSIPTGSSCAPPSIRACRHGDAGGRWQGNQLQSIANAAWGARNAARGSRACVRARDARISRGERRGLDDAMQRCVDRVHATLCEQDRCKRFRADPRNGRSGGSAAATSRRTSSTTCSRRAASRAPPSSRSSTAPRSCRASSPDDTLDRPAGGDPARGRRDLAAHRRRAAERPAPMTLRDGLALFEEHASPRR